MEAELVVAKRELVEREDKILKQNIMIETNEERTNQLRERSENLEVQNSNMSREIDRKNNQIVILETKAAEQGSSIADMEQLK